MNEETPLIRAQSSADLVLPDREWSGELAYAAGKGALFSLYLAIHCQPGAEQLRIEDEVETVTDNTDFPARLNHYKRPALQADDTTVTMLAVTSRMVQSGHAAAFSLWQSMHPDPLSARDDSKRIPSEVRDNCSLATQQRLIKRLQPVIEVDETLIADVIAGSETLLTV